MAFGKGGTTMASSWNEGRFKGRPDGCWVHYFSSGDIAKRACYDKGLYEGHVISYRTNGSIRLSQYYQRGKMTPVVPFHLTLMARR